MFFFAEEAVLKGLGVCGGGLSEEGEMVVEGLGC